MKKLFGLAIIGIVATTSGCASIITGTNQSLSVETKSKTANLNGATCKLTNDKGVWFVTTPGSVTVHRAYGELAVKCEKDGIEPGLVSVKSSTKGMLAGNILFGGGIGAAVDMANGSAYDYPDLITVVMGESNVVAPPAPPAPAAQEQKMPQELTKN